MSQDRKINIVIAENSPVISAGISQCIRKIQEIAPHLSEVASREELMQTVRLQPVDLLIINPTFSGLFHPSQIREISYNSEMKIYAIEVGKLSRLTLSLFDNHINVTDDQKTLKDKILFAKGTSHIEDNEKETLSVREKEIISYVVKGFTNQEIADKLFISIHTVITHRRNIAKKLEIHSATGLTIYAIVNKIVDLNDIKL